MRKAAEKSNSMFYEFWLKQNEINQFVVKGGVAIREINALVQNKNKCKKPLEKYNNLLCPSTLDAYSNNLNHNENVAVLSDKEEDLQSVSVRIQEERKQTLIREFLIMFDKSEEKIKTKMLFLKNCKKINWPNRSELIILFLDFCYDSSNIGDANVLSLLLIYLLEVQYITREHIKNGLKEFTKTYSEYEVDAPKVNRYFANLCFELIQVFNNCLKNTI
jgi:hypothetical protein